MSKISERLREHDARIGSPVAFEAANLLDEAERALAACLAGDPGWLINVRTTLARIRGEKA